MVKLFNVQNYETESAANLPQPSTENQPSLSVPQIPSPDNPPWNNWAAIGTWIASIIFIAVLPLAFLLPYLSKQHLDFTNQEAVKNFALTDPTAVCCKYLP
ncbi:MAG: hypothetical protein ACR2N3_16040 [Pyrinomonadaceae bacterium]